MAACNLLAWQASISRYSLNLPAQTAHLGMPIGTRQLGDCVFVYSLTQQNSVMANKAGVSDLTIIFNPPLSLHQVYSHISQPDRCNSS